VLAEADWRLVFWVNVPLALGAAVATRLVPAPAASHVARFDVAGVALVAAVVGALALAITEGPAQGWTSPPIVALLAAAAVLGVVLLLVERRARSPVLDPAVLAVRSFAVATGAGAVFFFAFLGNTLLGVLVLQGAWGYSPLKAGLAVAPSAAVATFFAPLAGRLVDRFGARTIGSAGLALFAVALVLLALGLPEEPAYVTRYLPFAIVASLGISMAFPAITQSATHELPPSAMGTGTGVLSTIRQTGGVLGIATVVSLLGDLPDDIASYHVAYWLLALAAVLAGLVMLGLRPHARPG
jgi:MFS family permease